VSARREASEVAPGVFRLGTPWANFYLVAAEGEFVLVDAGYPRYWPQVERVLAQFGAPLDAIAAVIVTHHHVDHAGTAEQARSAAGATVFVHEADAPVVEGDRASHPPHGFYREAWRLTMIRYLAHTVRVGGAGYRPVAAVESLREDDVVLDVPARPRVIHTPGHTPGHCSVLLKDRGVLFAGDAIQNYDYATGRTGLQQHRFNEDRQAALESLDHLAELDADVVLFGHGEPWRDGARRAVEAVQQAARAR
jgi:glyoxylase-like metal-dependent hydrolase (beta-lactamase superfamily II)